MCPGTARNNPALDIDPAAEVDRIIAWLRRSVPEVLRKRGVIVSVNGDVNSAVTLALAERAFGRSGAVALVLTERCEPSQSPSFLVASLLGVETVAEDITATIEAFGCNRRRDEAIRHVVPAYQPHGGCAAEVVTPADAESLHLFHLAVALPGGRRIVTPLPTRQFLTIVAAAHARQRIRMNYLYLHAEMRDFATAGALDRASWHSGSFAKWGENGVDLLPLVHLYPHQVRAVAEFLGVPREILDQGSATAPPAVDFQLLDALDHDAPPELAAEAAGVSVDQALRAYRDMLHQRQLTEYLRTPPLTIDG